MTFKPRGILPLLIAIVLLLCCATAFAAGNLLGDADSDGEVTILDATAVQRFLAKLPVTGGLSESLADVDMSGEIEITDTTYIQRWLAELDTPYAIGQQLEIPTEAPTEAPTETMTEAPTESPTNPPVQWPTDEEGWGTIVIRP